MITVPGFAFVRACVIERQGLSRAPQLSESIPSLAT